MIILESGQIMPRAIGCLVQKNLHEIIILGADTIEGIQIWTQKEAGQQKVV